MFGVPAQLGYPALFALIFAESAGVPVPGETALLTAGVLAGAGHLALPLVVAVAIAAAVMGDTIGYWLGRRGGRAVLTRRGPLMGWRTHALEAGERFFERHGAKTVFIGRFFSLLRVTSAWLAGISQMAWWRFLAWNAAGGIVWATLVGVVSYYFGRAAADAIAHYGAIGGGVLVALVLLAVVAVHVWRRRVVET
jgi:undecaprenyl-diphosphatase